MTNVVFQYAASQDKRPAPAPKVDPRTYRDARLSTFAAMETGNFDRAREVLAILEERYPEGAEALKIELIDAYNLTL